jgi:UrcA family protein
MITVVSKFALVVVAAVASAASFAGTSGADAPSVSVRYDDLNLSTTAGVDKLYRRITSAARDVCPDIYSRDTHVVLIAQRCQAAAITKAVSQVNNPGLAMLHAARPARG